jgi:hypothetical protein
MDKRIALLYIVQEFVADAFSFARTFGESWYVYNVNGSSCDLIRLYDLIDLAQPVVRDIDHTDVGFGSTESEVTGLGLCVADAVKNGGLPNIGDPNNPALKSHRIRLLISGGKDK